MESEKQFIAEINEIKKNINSLSQFISRLVKTLEEEGIITEEKVTEIVLGAENQ